MTDWTDFTSHHAVLLSETSRRLAQSDAALIQTQWRIEKWQREWPTPFTHHGDAGKQNRLLRIPPSQRICYVDGRQSLVLDIQTLPVIVRSVIRSVWLPRLRPESS